MMASHISPIRDPARLAALKETALLDSAPEEPFDRLTRLTADLIGAPVSLLTLVDDRRQFIKSSAGLREPWASQRETPLSRSLCKHVVTAGAPLVVTNAAEDRVVRNNPAVQDLGIGAYAGYPVQLEENRVLGDLCVIDTAPRQWLPEELSLLESMSALAEREIEQRVALRRSRRAAARNREELEELLTATPPFRTLVEHALVGIGVLDEHGFSYVNPRLAEIFRYTREEMIALGSPPQLASEEDRALVAENLRRRLEGEIDDIRYTFRGLRKDGHRIDVDVQGTRTQLGDRSVIISSLLDVTEQKTAERTLRDAEERYRMVVRASSGAVWDWDIQTGRVLWNGLSHQLLRYRPDQMGSSIGWWYERLHAEDRQPAINGLHAVLEGAGETWSHEHRFRRGDGSYATVLNCCSVLRDEDGSAVRVIGSMTDVTERKRQEETQRFLARASALLDESLDHELTFTQLARLAVPALGECCLVDLITKHGGLERVAVAHVDPALEQMLRDEDDDGDNDWLRRTATAVAQSKKRVLLPDAHDDPRAGAGPAEVRREWLKASGWGSVMMVPLLAHERVLGVITLATTISGRRYGPVDLLAAEDLAHRAALAIEHAQLFEEAHEAIDAREELLGVVTHDLLNPLNVIQLTTEFLLDQAQERRTENVQKLELIQRASSEMHRMVQDLMDVSRLESDRFSLDSADEEVASLVAEAEALLTPMASQKSVRLDFTVQPGLAPVRIDSHRMLRVISNLVGNAIKFTPKGGTVSLRAERGGDDVRFTVSDTGPGISPELLSHVFDRYWQARSGDRRGAGLGLAIAKGIVEAHGGSIWAESPPGSGAVFTFTVPTSAGAEQRRRRARPA